MARLKKGEPKPGKIFTCLSCGKERYISPGQIGEISKSGYECQKCKIKNSFNFSCSICSKIVYTQPSQVKYRNRSTCSMICRSILMRKRANERRVGYTKHQLDRLARYSPEAEKWRKAIFSRDDYTCQICTVRGTYLEADHIKPWAFFPELRFELSNGRTLCRPCHDKTKISAKRMKEIWG